MPMPMRTIHRPLATALVLAWACLSAQAQTAAASTSADDDPTRKRMAKEVAFTVLSEDSSEEDTMSDTQDDTPRKGDDKNDNDSPGTQKLLI